MRAETGGRGEAIWDLLSAILPRACFFLLRPAGLLGGGDAGAACSAEFPGLPGRGRPAGTEGKSCGGNRRGARVASCSAVMIAGQKIPDLPQAADFFVDSCKDHCGLHVLFPLWAL